MAFAKKCDRCGKLYEMYDIKRDQKRYCSFIFSNDNGRFGKKDLCPVCMMQLINWYYGTQRKNKKEIVKEEKEDADNVSL